MHAPSYKDTLFSLMDFISLTKIQYFASNYLRTGDLARAEADVTVVVGTPINKQKDCTNHFSLIHLIKLLSKVKVIVARMRINNQKGIAGLPASGR